MQTIGTVTFFFLAARLIADWVDAVHMPASEAYLVGCMVTLTLMVVAKNLNARAKDHDEIR